MLRHRLGRACGSALLLLCCGACLAPPAEEVESEAGGPALAAEPSPAVPVGALAELQRRKEGFGKPRSSPWRPVAIEGEDLVWSEVHQRFLVAVRGDRSLHANSLAFVDPRTGAVETAVPVGAWPHRVVLTADEKYAYVALALAGQIVRVDLESREVDQRIDVGDGRPDLMPLDLDVAPANSELVAVVLGSRGHASAPRLLQVLLDGGSLGYVEFPAPPEALCFDEASETLHVYGSQETLYELPVDGLVLGEPSERTARLGGFGTSGDCLGGRWFSVQGAVRLADGAGLVIFPPGARFGRLDRGQRLYIAVGPGHLWLWDADAGDLLEEYEFSGFDAFSARSVALWGDRGVAVLVGKYLLLLDFRPLREP